MQQFLVGLDVGSTTVKAIVEYIWNPAPNFSLGVFAVWENSNQGFQEFGNNGPGTKFKTVSGSQNMFSIGTRPVYWITDTIAIQGQANYTYEDNNRGYAGANSFGRSGSMGVFTIAPSIKPKGGYFTRPELRLFATFACWSDSLKGSTTPVGEGGNLSGAVGPFAHRAEIRMGDLDCSYESNDFGEHQPLREDLLGIYPGC